MKIDLNDIMALDFDALLASEHTPALVKQLITTIQTRNPYLSLGDWIGELSLADLHMFDFLCRILGNQITLKYQSKSDSTKDELAALDQSMETTMMCCSLASSTLTLIASILLICEHGDFMDDEVIQNAMMIIIASIRLELQLRDGMLTYDRSKLSVIHVSNNLDVVHIKDLNDDSNKT